MASYLPPIVGVLTADISSFSRGMATAKTEAEAATSHVGKAFTGMSKVGLIAGAGLVAGVAVVGVASLKMAADFQTATNTLVTSAGESRDSIEQVRSGILSMAGQVGYSAMDLARAMYTVDSAGFTAAKGGLTVLRAAAEGAKAENADLRVVADAVTSALIDYHKGAGDAAQTTTTLIAAVSQGKTTFAELTGSLHSVLPIASAYHISLADITAATASMTVHGMSAQQATDNLRHTIEHLGTTTAPQRKELALLGIDAQNLSKDLGEKGLTGTLLEISKAIQTHMGANGQVILQMQTALRGLPPEVQKLGAAVIDGSMSLGDFSKAAKGLNVEQAGLAHQFATLMTSTHGIGSAQKTGAELMQSYASALKAATGDSTTLNTALMLTGENADTTNRAVKAVSGATVEAGNHVAGWGSIQKTFNQQLSQAKDALGATGIAIGTGLLPPMTSLLTKITPVVTAIADWTSKHEGATAVILGSFGVIGTLLTTLVLASTIVKAVSTALETLRIVQIAVRTATSLGTAVQWALNVALSANPIGLIIIGVAALAAGVIFAYNHFGWFHDAVNRAWDALKAFGAWLGNTLGPILHGIGDLIGNVASALGGIAHGASGLASAAAGAGMPAMAEGGIVTRPTIALIGEDGPEAVVPLRQLRSGSSVSASTSSAPAVAGASMDDTNALLEQQNELLAHIVSLLTPRSTFSTKAYNP